MKCEHGYVYECPYCKRESAPAPAACSAFLLPLDLAMIRWSVRCRTWQEMSAGSQPELGPFLAGWFCRCIGAGMVVDGQFRDSFRVGWKEADDHVSIAEQGREDREEMERRYEKLEAWAAMRDAGHDDLRNRLNRANANAQNSGLNEPSA